jgi:hypothetical protein
MLALGGTALVTLYVNPILGGKLVAVALICHVARDAHHYLCAKQVVSCSYVEFCAAFGLPAGRVHPLHDIAVDDRYGTSS